MTKVCIQGNGDAGFICDLCGLFWLDNQATKSLEKAEEMKKYEEIFNHLLQKNGFIRIGSNSSTQVTVH